MLWSFNNFQGIIAHISVTCKFLGIGRTNQPILDSPRCRTNLLKNKTNILVNKFVENHWVNGRVDRYDNQRYDRICWVSVNQFCSMQRANNQEGHQNNAVCSNDDRDFPLESPVSIANLRIGLVSIKRNGWSGCHSPNYSVRYYNNY